MTQEVLKEMLSPHVCDDVQSNRAWKRAWEIGFPTRKNESFKKHDLASLLVQRSKSNHPLKVREEKIDGVTMLTLKEAKASHEVFLQNISSKAIDRETNLFCMLNEACCDDGLFFHVTKDLEKPIWIDDVVEQEGSIFLRKIVIFVARGKRADFVLQRKLLPNVSCNCVVEVILEHGAHCRMIDLDLEGNEDASSMMHVRAQVKQDAHFAHYSATKGGALTRSDFYVELLGEYSEVDLQGVWMLDQKRTSHTEIRIEHKAPNTRSNQHYKGVLKDKSRSTFDGKIYVESIAQKTEAYQLNNNLVLDLGAAAFSKPNLEIFADDVKASHGATITELNDDEIFYLMTRGINKREAKELLTKGFTDAIVNQFFDEEARRIVNGI